MVAVDLEKGHENNLYMSSKIFDNLKIEEISSKENPYSSSFVFRHLPPTMGITIGNFLRRIISDSIEGIAPLGIKIDTNIDGKIVPVRTEVGVIKGLRETIPYFIINLKKILVEEKKKKEGL